MKKTTKVYFNGVLECGAYINGAVVEVSEDYGMNELVRAIKAAGYKAFITGNMKVLAKV